MKKKLMLKMLILLTLFLHARAQEPNKDSSKLAIKIAVAREKLVKLQNSLPDLEKEKENTAQQAQESANANRKAANRLSNDPDDRTLAKRADRRAGNARSDASKARKAEKRLNDTRKDIRKLEDRIRRDEKEFDQKYKQKASLSE